MQGLQARILRLERAEGVGLDAETRRLEGLSDYEVLAELGRLLGADVSTLSKTVQESFSKGFSCWLAELAALLGVELTELKGATQGETALEESVRCRWSLWARSGQLPPPTTQEQTDAELDALLAGFTDNEVARLRTCLSPAGGRPVSEAEVHRVWDELCAARDKRLRGHDAESTG